MNKMVSYDGIGYVAATYKVDATTIAYLEANKVNAKTGNVDINDARLAVKLNSDGTVGFGASTPTTADAVFGVIRQQAIGAIKQCLRNGIKVYLYEDSIVYKHLINTV